MPKTAKHLVDKARDLRVNKRLSNYEISVETGIPVGTLSPYLKDIPLSESEISHKRDAGRAKGRAILLETRSKIKDRHDISDRYDLTKRASLSTNQKCIISELAVRLRISELGLVCMTSDTPGLKFDLVSHNLSTNTFCRIQVKSGYWPKYGNASVVAKSRKSRSYTSYDPTEYDVLISYIAENELFHILTSTEVDMRISGSTLALRDEDINAWHKIL